MVTLKSKKFQTIQASQEMKGNTLPVPFLMEKFVESME